MFVKLSLLTVVAFLQVTTVFSQWELSNYQFYDSKPKPYNDYGKQMYQAFETFSKVVPMFFKNTGSYPNVEQQPYKQYESTGIPKPYAYGNQNGDFEKQFRDGAKEISKWITAGAHYFANNAKGFFHK